MGKKILLTILALVLIGVCTGIYMWNKPHKKVEQAEGIVIDARVLAKEYSTDEKAADTKYLNKAIEVKGTIDELEKTQDGGLMVILKTDDVAAGVQCAMREKGLALKRGHIVIKGFCSGGLMGSVSLTDCVIVQ
ncbi:MAG: hypothetical protein JWQ38_1181 [Flavipsychrobacter sp.]|nr:hypothetical protein [Flavipsychrobacter sp.]